VGLSAQHRHIRRANASCERSHDGERAYYSTVFTQSADDVWDVIRDFNDYPVWVDGSGASEIEDCKSGDAVGAVRNVLYQGQTHPANALGVVRCRPLANLRVLWRTADAGTGLSRDAADRPGHRRRPRARPFRHKPSPRSEPFWRSPPSCRAWCVTSTAALPCALSSGRTCSISKRG